MKSLLIELIVRENVKQDILNKINELFIIGPATKVKKQPIQDKILSSLNMNWSPRNVMLVNECLEEIGAKVTRSRGFYHFINIINKEVSIIPDNLSIDKTPSGAGGSYEQGE